MRGRLIVLAIVGLIVVVGIIGVLSVPGLRWRAQVYAMKATGKLSDLTWSEVARWSMPGSPVYLGDLPNSRSPYAAIENSMTSEKDVKEGEQLFRARCAPCHGFEGEGIVGPSLHQLRRSGSDWALFRIITKGIPGTAMLGHELPDRDVWQLAGYVRTLSRQAAPDSMAAANARAFPRVPVERILEANHKPTN